MLKLKNKKLPEFFKPLFWSFDFNSLDLDKHLRIIIINTINYGDLNHWHWLAEHYGQKKIRKILSEIPVSELRLPVRQLASLIFDIKKFNYESRSAHIKS